MLIHGQILREDQVDSFKALGVIPVALPDAHLLLGRLAPRPHGRARAWATNISPTGWARKRGMIFTSHHDAPVAFPDSMRVLDATVTRARAARADIVGPQQRVDVITGAEGDDDLARLPALRGEDQGQSIEVGKLADFVILSKDPTAVDPTTIADIQVTETIKEGATVFRLAPPGGRTASDRSGETFARMLHAMAHPAPAAGGAPVSPGWARLRAQVAANLPPGNDNLCQADVIMWLADAMARGN